MLTPCKFSSSIRILSNSGCLCCAAGTTPAYYREGAGAGDASGEQLQVGLNTTDVGGGETITKPVGGNTGRKLL